MKIRQVLMSVLLVAAPAAMAGPVRVDFTVFPGADQTLGTSDDLPVALSGGQTRFTNAFAFLDGGVGFLVDSLCCAPPQGAGLGAITNRGGENVLVQARPDLDVFAFTFGSLQFRMVGSADGNTPAHVTSIDIRLSPGSSGTIDFFNPRNDLRFRAVVPHEGSTNVLYSDADGLAQIVFTGTGGVDLFEFDATAPLTEPPPFVPAVVMPEPGTLGLLILGLLLPLMDLRRRR